MTLHRIRKRASGVLSRLEKAWYMGQKVSSAQRRELAVGGHLNPARGRKSARPGPLKAKRGAIKINTALDRLYGQDISGRRSDKRTSAFEQRTIGGILRRSGSYSPMKKRGKPADIGFTFEFAKSSVTGKYVWGWASVIEENGKPVLDSQGDLIVMDDSADGKGLRSAAHHFVKSAREAKAMHAGDRIGDVVESVIIDDDFAKAHGITHGKRGWWIGMEIADPAIQKRVASGEYRAFSIGGAGRRKALD